MPVAGEAMPTPGEAATERQMGTPVVVVTMNPPSETTPRLGMAVPALGTFVPPAVMLVP